MEPTSQDNINQELAKDFSSNIATPIETDVRVAELEAKLSELNDAICGPWPTRKTCGAAVKRR